MAISASKIVSMVPSVVSAGSSNLVLNGVLVDQSTLLPVGAVKSFSSASAVGDYFGTSSTQYTLASIYFNGFTNCSMYPSALIFAPYAAAARSAWLMGGSLSGMTLTQLQAISGTLTITIDGVTKTASALNLATATSFSNAASLMITALSLSAGQVVWNSTLSAFQFLSLTTGTASTITVASGTTAASLMLTAATGAVLSQGSAVDTPTTAMNNVTANTKNWACFTTTFEPDTATKLLFSVWANNQSKQYAYVGWDSDVLAATTNPATTTFGYQVMDLEYEGTMPISGYSATAIANGTTLANAAMQAAVFCLAVAASIDFSRTNGRITGAFKTQSGIVPTCDTDTTSVNLLANGYSYIGKYATRNDDFTFLYNGQMSGTWLWFDTFINQVYYNSAFQTALMDLLTNMKSIPYNDSGYEMIRAAMKDVIEDMLDFGAIRTGVTLSDAQVVEITTAAGSDVSSTIESQGWYLQILDPGATIRAQRGTPVINFWYTDGGSVQSITVDSICVM
jgi:hypothetical protein